MESNNFCLCRAAASGGVSKDQAGVIVGASSGRDPDEVVVTVQGDGVVTYDGKAQTRTQSWPLGSSLVRFILPAACDKRSGHFYAAVKAIQGASTGNFLLSWPSGEAVDKGAATGGSFSLWSAAKRGDLLQSELHSLHPLSGPFWAPSEVSRKCRKGGGDDGVADQGEVPARAALVVVFLDGTLAAYSGDAKLICTVEAATSAGDGRRTTMEAAVSVRMGSGKGKLGSEKGVGCLRLVVLAAESVRSSADESGADAGLKVGGSGRHTIQRVLRLYTIRDDHRAVDDTLKIELLHTAVLDPPCDSSSSDAPRVHRILAASLSDADTLSVFWSDGTFDVFRGLTRAGLGNNVVQKVFSRKIAALDLQEKRVLATPASLSKSSKKRRATTIVQDVAESQGCTPHAAMVAVPRSSYVVFVGQQKGITGNGSATPLQKGVARRENDGLVVIVVDTLYGCVHSKVVVANTEEGEQIIEKQMKGVSGVDLGSGSLAGGLQVAWVGIEGGVLTLSTSQSVIVVVLDLPPLSLAMMVGAFADIPTGSPGTGEVGMGGSVVSEVDGMMGNFLSPKVIGRWDGLRRSVGRTTREVLGDKGVAEIVKPKLRGMTRPVWREEDGGMAERDGSSDKQVKTEMGEGKERSLQAHVVSRNEVVSRRLSGGPWDMEQVNSIDDEERDVIDAVQDESATPSMDAVMRRVWSFLDRKDCSGASDLDVKSPPGGYLVDGRGDSDVRSNARPDAELDLIANGDARGGEGVDAEGRRKWKRVLRKGRRRLMNMSSGLAEALVLRSIKSKFWSLLGALIEFGLVNGPLACPNLLSASIESKQPLLLEKCAFYMSDLPAASVALFIKVCLSGGKGEARGWKSLTKAHRAAARSFFSDVESKPVALRMNELEDAEEELDDETAIAAVAAHREFVGRAAAAVLAVDCFTPREQCLHAAVAVDRDRTVLTSALSRLNATEVVGLMRYLEKWLNCYSERFLPFVSPKSIPGLPIPSMRQVLNWCGLLLDSHFTRISLLSDCHQLLAKVKAVVSKHVKSTSKVAALSGVTTHLRSKCQIPAKRALAGRVSSADYSIEYIQLD